MKLNNYHKQQGFSITLLIGLIALLGIIGFLGSTIYTSIIGGNQRSNLSIQSSQSLTQASYILATEITRNASGIPIAKAILANGFAPSGGGIIPTSSAAPKLDSYGSYIGYCVNATPTAQTDSVFAIISAGADKNFNTTCTQALAGTTVGDDKVITKNVASINSGVGGTVFFGDPVPTVADLANLTAASIKPGQLRTVLADGSIYVNATGVAGASNWTKAGAAGSSGGGSGGTGPSVMYLYAAPNANTVNNTTGAPMANGDAAACPSGWTQTDYKTSNYTGSMTNLEVVRTCINPLPFSIIYLYAAPNANTVNNTTGVPMANGDAAACPSGWTQADYKTSNYNGSMVNLEVVRTCYIAQIASSGGSGSSSNKVTASGLSNIWHKGILCNGNWYELSAVGSSITYASPFICGGGNTTIAFKSDGSFSINYQCGQPNVLTCLGKSTYSIQDFTAANAFYD